MLQKCIRAVLRRLKNCGGFYMMVQQRGSRINTTLIKANTRHYYEAVVAGFYERLLVCIPSFFFFVCYIASTCKISLVALLAYVIEQNCLKVFGTRRVEINYVFCVLKHMRHSHNMMLTLILNIG